MLPVSILIRCLTVTLAEMPENRLQEKLEKKILVKWWEFQGDWLIIYTINSATPACKKEKVELGGGGKE